MMGFGMFGLIFMILTWGVLIALALWVVGSLFSPVGRRPAPTGDHLTAQQIVEMRYARGEITREQYELMKRDLG
ncbi:MAG: SHOCT domain-containing protein [Anaerolineae bacterium]